MSEKLKLFQQSFAEFIINNCLTAATEEKNEIESKTSKEISIQDEETDETAKAIKIKSFSFS
jgi:hypothetical protein